MRKFERMKKRLSLLLCLGLVLSCLPVGALAAQGDACTLTADCTGVLDAEGVCSVCGKTEKPAHAHMYQVTYAQKDDSVHTLTRACLSCPEDAAERADETHSYVNGLCVCGKEEPHQHSYVNGVCGCGEVCVHAEYVEGVCTLCGGLEPVAPTCVCEVSCGGDNGINPDCTVCLEDFWNCTHFVPTCTCAEKCSEEEPNAWCAICGTEGAEKCEGKDKGVTLENATSGDTGNVKWSYADGTLTIFGNGEMGNYNPSNAPWKSYKSDIRTVVIENDVTNIGSYAFYGCSSLTSVTIEGNVTSIGSSAFSSCSSLTTLNYLGDTAPGAVGDNAIPAGTTIYVPEGSSVTSFAGINTTVDPNLSGPETSTGVITITHDLSNQIVTEGKIIESIFFNATVSNNSELTYQWYQCNDGNKTNARAIEGATSNSYELPKNLTAGQYYYYCTISAEGAESLVTRVATVTVKVPHTITFTSTPIEGGTVSAKVGSSNVTQAIENTTVTLNVTLNDGYELEALTVKDADNGTVTVTDNKFTMPAKAVTVTATFKKKVNSSITLSIDKEVYNATDNEMSFTLAFSEDIQQYEGNPKGTIYLYIDGNKVANSWSYRSGQPTMSSRYYDLNLSSGEHKVYVEFVPTNKELSSVKSDPVSFNYGYSVTVAESQNGTVSTGKAFANAGEIVTLTVTPAEGYELDTLTVTDADNGTVTVTDNKFTMPAKNVTVTATFKVKTVQVYYPVGGKAEYIIVPVTDTISDVKAKIKEEIATVSGEIVIVARDTENQTFKLLSDDTKTISAYGLPATTAILAVDCYTVTVTEGSCENFTAESSMLHKANNEYYVPVGTKEILVEFAADSDCVLLSASIDGSAATCTQFAPHQSINSYYITIPNKDFTLTVNCGKKSAVTLAETTNGTVTASIMGITFTHNDNGKEYFSAAEGATVTLTVTPVEGYELDTLSYSDGTNTTAVTKDDEGKFTFTMPASNVTVTATFKLSHVHDWQYQVKNGTTNTIEAVCKNEDNNCDNTDGGTVKISASGGTYNGSDHKAELTISDDWVGNTLTDADISYEYKQNESGSYEGDTDLTKAGYYKASVTVGEVTAYVEYTVAQRELTLTAKAIDRFYKRGNTSVEIEDLVVDGILSENSVSVSCTDGTLTDDDVGTYSTVTLNGVTLSGDDSGNYKLPNSLIVEEEEGVTISPKPMTPMQGVVANVGATLLPYVENATNVPTVTVKDGDYTLVKDTDYVIVYKDEADKEVAAPNAVGKYMMYIQGVGGLSEDGLGGNYQGGYQIPFQISNAPNVANLIAALPDPSTVEPDDKAVIDAYVKAKTAYDALPEADKNLIAKDAKEKLEKVGKALTAYDIIKGHKSNYVKGSYKALTITANGYFGKFVGVEVDGKTLDPKYYTAESGSTIITLKTSYLESLKSGKHYVTVVYTDGDTGGEEYFRVSVNNGSPMTGDNSHPLLFTGMAVTALLAMAMLLLFLPGKKGKYQR